MCTVRREFTQQIARETRSVDEFTYDELMEPTDENKQIAYWVTELKDARGLTDWEKDFLESVGEQFREKEWLSEKQKEILERIYAERT